MSSSKSSIELYLENRINEYTTIINYIDCHLRNYNINHNISTIQELTYKTERFKSIYNHDREKLKMFIGNCNTVYSDKLTELYNILDEVDKLITKVENSEHISTHNNERQLIQEAIVSPVKSPVKTISPKNKTISQKGSPKTSQINITQKKTRKTTKTIPATVDYPKVTNTTIDSVITSFNNYFKDLKAIYENNAKREKLDKLKIPVFNTCCTNEERNIIQKAVFIAIQNQPNDEISQNDIMKRRREYVCIQHAVVFYYFISNLDETRMSYGRLFQLLIGYNNQNLSKDDKDCIIKYIDEIVFGTSEWSSYIRKLYMGKSIKHIDRHMENKQNMLELKNDLSSEKLTQHNYLKFDKILLKNLIDQMNKCATSWIKQQEPTIRKYHETFPELKCCSEEEIENLKRAINVLLNATYMEGEQLNMYNKFLNYYVIIRYYALRFFETEVAFSCYDLNVSGFDDESITYMKGILNTLTYGEETWAQEVRNILRMGPAISRKKNPFFKVNSNIIVDTLMI